MIGVSKLLKTSRLTLLKLQLHFGVTFRIHLSWHIHFHLLWRSSSIIRGLTHSTFYSLWKLSILFVTLGKTSIINQDLSGFQKQSLLTIARLSMEIQAAIAYSRSVIYSSSGSLSAFRRFASPSSVISEIAWAKS